MPHRRIKTKIKNLSKDNVILKDVLQGKSIERYTDELMQPVIDKYNEKQQKESRKIKVPYTEWHKSNKTLQKTQLVYEAVAQIGEHENLGKMYYEAEGEKREKLHGAFKKKEVIQMDEQTFESYKASADVKAIERRVESKIKEQEKAAQRLIQGLTTEKEEALQNQVQDLQQQLQQAQEKIKEKDKLIEKMKQKMEMVKEFMQNLNIMQRFKNWYEQKQIEKEGFYFEGQIKE